jgi:NAD(P)H-dependent FMN reductase
LRHPKEIWREAPCWSFLESDPIKQLKQAAQSADAFVLGSPVYHNSYCGTLKTILDQLSSEQFEAKPVALVSTSGSTRSPQAVDHLRLVVRALHGIAIPTQVITTASDYAFDGAAYQLISSQVQARIKALAEELLWVLGRLGAETEALTGGPAAELGCEIALHGPLRGGPDGEQ